MWNVKRFLISVLILMVNAQFASAEQRVHNKPAMLLLQAAAYAVQKCQNAHRYCDIAAYDESGEPILLLRMKNSIPMLMLLTRAKANTSALFRMSTAHFGAFTRYGKPFYGLNYIRVGTAYQLTGVPGGDVFKIDGKLEGSIAISNIQYKKGVPLFSVDYFNEQTVKEMVNLIEKINKTNKPIYDLNTFGLDENGKTDEDAVAFIHAAYKTMQLAYERPNIRMAIGMVGRAKVVDGLIRMHHTIDYASELVLDKATQYAMEQRYKTPYPRSSIQAADIMPAYGDQKTGIAITYYLANKGYLYNLHYPAYLKAFKNTFLSLKKPDAQCMVNG